MSGEMTGCVDDVYCSVVEEVDCVLEGGDWDARPGEDERGVEGCFGLGWEGLG